MASSDDRQASRSAVQLGKQSSRSPPPVTALPPPPPGLLHQSSAEETTPTLPAASSWLPSINAVQDRVHQGTAGTVMAYSTGQQSPGERSAANNAQPSTSKSSHSSSITLQAGASDRTLVNDASFTTPKTTPLAAAAAAASSSSRLLNGHGNDTASSAEKQGNTPPSTSTTTTTGGMPSKSILTVALQKAQSAVLLDGAGNEEAAISAYEQSVKLLKQVMQRVEESASSWRAKELEKLDALRERRLRRRSGGGIEQVEEETAEERKERERREQKLAKREKMRMDERRRLKVIHDTYEERIRVLSADIAERVRAEEVNRFQQEVPGPSTPKRASNRSSRTSMTGEGIGAAMLSGSLTSPTQSSLDHSHASQSRSSMESPDSGGARTSAVPFPVGSPSKRHSRTSFHNERRLSRTPPPSLPAPNITPINFSNTFADMPDFTATGTSQRDKGRSPLVQQTDQAAAEEKSMLEFSPQSDTSRQSRSASQMMNPPPLAGTSGRHAKGDSVASGSSSSSAKGKATKKGLGIATFSANENIGNAFDIATPTPDTAAFDHTSLSGGSRKHNGPREGGNGDTRSRSTSQASSGAAAAHSNLARVMSSESLSSQASDSVTSHALFSATAPKIPLPPIPNALQQDATSPVAAFPTRNGVGNRQSRSHSVAAGARPGSKLGSDPKSLLVNTSTDHGTISQRRRSPDPASYPNVGGLASNGFVQHPSQAQTLSEDDPDSQNPGRLTALGIIDQSGRNAAAVAASIHTVGPAAGPSRSRALSQPSRRPAIATYNSEVPVPVLPSITPPAAPHMQRADSDPAASSSALSNGLPALTVEGPAGAQLSSRSSRAASSSPSTLVGAQYAGINEDDSVRYLGRQLDAGSTSFMEPDTPASGAAFSMTPNNDASLSDGTLRQMDANVKAGSPGSLSEYIPAPQDPLRRPFHIMRQLRSSIQSGSFVTPRLYVPKSLWTQNGIKLVHLETKIMVLDLLLVGLEGLERTSQSMGANKVASVNNPPARVDAVNRLVKELDTLEALLDDVQATLSKKLGFIEPPKGKKGGQNSLSSWGSKFSKTMEKMTKGKNLDAPETYVAAIARLCLHVQVVDQHIACLRQPPSYESKHLSTVQSGLQATYAELPHNSKVALDQRLRRCSDFFAKVICRMIITDLGVWLDKYSKRASAWTVE